VASQRLTYQFCNQHLGDTANCLFWTRGGLSLRALVTGGIDVSIVKLGGTITLVPPFVRHQGGTGEQCL
jgi:hypothetical protein